MLNTLNAVFPIRYTVLGLSVFALLLSVFSVLVFGVGFGSLLITACWSAWGCTTCARPNDLFCATTPSSRHLRFILEFVRPEIRQYFIESDNEARRSQGLSVHWCTSGLRGTRTSGPLAPS